MDIGFNLKKIEQEINAALGRVGQEQREVKVVAVTKNRSVDEINEVLASGYQILGENRVQELQAKYTQITDQAQWHLIGHLQRNKVRYITDKVQLIHSLDSYRLAKEINKRMKVHERAMSCLVQVNVAQEESKYGLEVNQLLPFLKEVTQLPLIKIKGLMTIAPEVDNPEEVRPVFKELADVFANIKKSNLPGIDMDFLSMGMTNDFSIAVEEGANMVRIGSAIFGPR